MILNDTLKKILKLYLPKVIINKIKKEHYFRILKSFSLEAEPDLLIVKEFVAEGDFVIDIGANIGVYTKYLSEFVKSSGRVISIEPIPITYGFLINNIEKMGMQNIITYNVAIAEKEYTSNMYIPSGVSGENYFRAKAIKTDQETEKLNLRAIEVNFVPLDKLVNSLNKSISFIKIDVEGFELTVIKGAKKTLEKNKPSLLIEIEGNPSEIGSTAESVLKHLQCLDYEPYIFVGKKLKVWEIGETSVNYFFFNEYHKKILIDKGIIK